MGNVKLADKFPRGKPGNMGKKQKIKGSRK